MMVCVVCARLWREPATYRLLRVHIYIGIHSTFFGRISMRTDSSSWKFYLLAVFCTCILPFPAEFPELLAGRRGNFFMAFQQFCAARQNFYFLPLGGVKNSTKLAEYPELPKVLVPTYCIIIFVLVPPLTDAIGQQPDDEPPLTSRSMFSIQPWRYYLSRQ